MFLNIFRYLLTVFLFISCNNSFGQKNSYIKPIGTYEMQNKAVIEDDGETYGYFGTIQVKALSNNKIVMTFYICKGAPSYNSGSFVDTLFYKDNNTIYKDGDCITTFTFTTNGISVKEKSNRNCWGQGVYAHGYFKKVSSKIPKLVEPLSGEEIK